MSAFVTCTGAWNEQLIVHTAEVIAILVDAIFDITHERTSDSAAPHAVLGGQALPLPVNIEWL